MYIDTANIDEIKEALSLGIIKGVTTNPTILLKENSSRSEQIQKILDLDVGRLYVQLVGDTCESLYEDYCSLYEMVNKDSRVAYKIAMNSEGLRAVKRIKEDNPEANVLATAIYSSDQAVLAGLAGCDSCAPYVNRMANNSIDPFAVISQTKAIFKARGISCQIIGASFKNTKQVIDAFINGSDTVTISMDILKAMCEKELANSAIKVFHEHDRLLEEKVSK